MIRAFALVLACTLCGAAYGQCRQALALGVDVSASVDEREYRLQIDGLAAALNAPEVRDKFFAMPNAPVRLLIYEWSGPGDQVTLVPWTTIDTQSTLQIVIETLRQTRRRAASPGTALGEAMLQGAAHLAEQGACWKQTLDLSGDGKSNLGPRPGDAKQRLQDRGIVINALVIGVDDPDIGDMRQTEIGELAAYFRSNVILGPDAFVLTAIGFSDYTRAMTEKLRRELEGLVVSRLIE